MKIMLTEGGLYGHLYHLYENPSMTFAKIKNILRAASRGELVGVEKTDGQNLYLTFNVKEGQAKAARNKSNVKQGGMSRDQLAAKFEGRGSLHTAFVEGFDMFESTMQKLSDELLIKIFGPAGNVYFSVEIMDPRNSNVINYDLKTVALHSGGHGEFDKATGARTERDVSANYKTLQTVIDKISPTGEGSDNWRLINQAVMQLRSFTDQRPLEQALASIDQTLAKYGVSENDSVSILSVSILLRAVHQIVPNVSDDVSKAIIAKILGHKGINIKNHILRHLQPQEQLAVRDFIKTSGPNILKGAFAPIEMAVHQFAVAALKALDSAYILDNSQEIGRLRQEVEKAINIIQRSDNEAAMTVLQQQLQKLQGADQISTAAEGFVFNFEGQDYKFTGHFAPINQILGMFRYGRGKIPPLKDLEGAADMDLKEAQARDSGRKIYGLFPGKFKPPHREHFGTALKLLQHSKADKIYVIISPREVTDSSGLIKFDPVESKQIWDLYLESYPNIEAVICPVASPVRYVYELAVELASHNSEIYVALGERERGTNDGKRFDRLQVFLDKKAPGSKMNIFWSPSVDISATDMRNSVAQAIYGNGELERKQAKKKFLSFLPDHLKNDDVEVIWQILADREVDNVTTETEPINRTSDSLYEIVSTVVKSVLQEYDKTLDLDDLEEAEKLDDDKILPPEGEEDEKSEEEYDSKELLIDIEDALEEMSGMGGGAAAIGMAPFKKREQ